MPNELKTLKLLELHKRPVDFPDQCDLKSPVEPLITILLIEVLDGKYKS